MFGLKKKKSTKRNGLTINDLWRYFNLEFRGLNDRLDLIEQKIEQLKYLQPRQTPGELPKPTTLFKEREKK